MTILVSAKGSGVSFRIRLLKRLLFLFHEIDLTRRQGELDGGVAFLIYIWRVMDLKFYRIHVQQIFEKVY